MINNVIIPLKDKVYADIVDGVLGQLSDGMWENSPRMEKFWRAMSFPKQCPEGFCIEIENAPDEWCDGDWNFDETKFKMWIANKIKQVVKEEGLDWNRNNTETASYLDDDATVADAYYLYEYLKGRNMNRNWKDEDSIQRVTRLRGEEEARKQAAEEAKRLEAERKNKHIEAVLKRVYPESKDTMRATDAYWKSSGDWWKYYRLLQQQMDKITDSGKAIRRPVAFYKEMLRHKNPGGYSGYDSVKKSIEDMIDRLNESVNESFNPRVSCRCALCGDRIWSNEMAREIELDDGTETVCLDCYEENT